jgi:hypothetical protein
MRSVSKQPAAHTTHPTLNCLNCHSYAVNWRYSCIERLTIHVKHFNSCSIHSKNYEVSSKRVDDCREEWFLNGRPESSSSTESRTGCGHVMNVTYAFLLGMRTVSQQTEVGMDKLDLRIFRACSCVCDRESEVQRLLRVLQDAPASSTVVLKVHANTPKKELGSPLRNRRTPKSLSHN